MRPVWLLGIAFAIAAAATAWADTVSVIAANNVPVVMIEASRGPGYTLVRLQTQTALQRVCWTTGGDDSPYLLAAGRRYRFQGGDNITPCPTRRDYTQGEIMVLRFELLDPQVHEFSLVEGHGGENQLVDPASSKVRYWNFLHVPLR